MKRKSIIILSIVTAILLAIVLACNLLVVRVSKGKCYDDIDAIPHNTFGLLLGTGRSSKPSPYYEARVQAAIDLYKAGKIDYIIVSGENLYDDYNEVDSMLADLKKQIFRLKRLIIMGRVLLLLSIRMVMCLDIVTHL